MGVGAVREPRHGGRHDELARRRSREFHNVRNPTRRDLRIERILVCPSGIHVVTSVPADSDRFLVSRSKVAADLVASLLPERYRGRVHPVLCRLDDVAMADLVNDVLVTTASTLEHIARRSPVVLSTSEVNEIALRLDARLEPFPLAQKTRQRRWTWRRGLLAGLATAAPTAGILTLADGVGLTALSW